MSVDEKYPCKDFGSPDGMSGGCHECKELDDCLTASKQRVNRDIKLQVIKKLGVNLELVCPADYGITKDKYTNCSGYFDNGDCGICWIKALEGDGTGT